MRRTCFALLMLIFIFGVPFGIACEDLESMQFKLFFQKPGETDFHFTKKGTTTMIEDEAFDSYSGIESTVPASFGFDWALYYEGNVSMKLVFAPTLAAADTSYDDRTYTDYMLLATDDVLHYKRLNYVATITAGTGDGAGLIGTSTGSSSHKLLTIADRSLVLLDNKTLSDISGSRGHVDIDLTLTIPPKEDEKALMTTQYEGVVKLYIESN